MRHHRFHRPHLHRPHLHTPHFTPDQTIWLLIDKNLRPRVKNYLFQCALATLALVVILLVQNAVFSAAIVVAVASTAFTVFVFPNSIASGPRRLLGGQVVAMLSGAVFIAILQLPAVEQIAPGTQYATNVAAGLAVGLGILLMVATNTEHPPAAGVTLGLVMDSWQWSAIIFVLTSALAFTIIRALLRPRMINLI